MFTVLCKARSFNLPIDVQLELFEVLAVPVILYSCEVWSSDGCDILGKIHLRFCKIILSLRKSTPSCIVHGELGRKPLEIIAKTRALSFWARRVTTMETSILYKLLYNMHLSGFYYNSWIMILENTMNECGYSGIWSNQTLNVSLNVFKNMIKTRLNDQYCQLWRSDVF